MTLRYAPVLASLALFGLIGACSKPAAPADAAAVSAEPSTPVAASASNVAFDVRAFAGSFTGILPCTACQGIDTRVELNPDGTFRLVETYQGETDGGPFEITGTWTAESAGKQVLLDPDSKSEPDHRYEIVSANELRLLDLEGKPVVTTYNTSLLRQLITNP